MECPDHNDTEKKSRSGEDRQDEDNSRSHFGLGGLLEVSGMSVAQNESLVSNLWC